MFTFLLIVTIICFIVLVLVAGMHPVMSELSTYELHRRADNHDRPAAELLRRRLLHSGVVTILKIMTGFLLIATAFLLVATFGTAIGAGSIVIVLIMYGAFARLNAVQKISRRIYGFLEPSLLRQVEKSAGFMNFIRSDVGTGQSLHLGSKQELEHLIDHSDGVLTPEDKKLVVHSLRFADSLVASIMTPVDKIVSIKKTEFLGPLTLDDLHKTGHSQLPVISQDIYHIVGILHLQNLLTLDMKRSVTAEKAMDPHVHYIRHDQTLPHALAALLRTHQHLFIVINESGETIGLVTLEDIIEALIGHTITYEFDSHESSRAVAAHNPNHKDN